MATEAKLPLSLNRPSSANAPHDATPLPLTVKPRSKLLATLNEEIPNWLAGPSNSSGQSGHNSLLKTTIGAATTMATEKTASFNTSVPKGAATKSKPASKGKAKATPTSLQRTTSDIENQPDVVSALLDGHPDEAAPQPRASKAPLSLYSYKQYRPTPTVVYTRHEEEANDLVQCLKGPLGFDLEWVVTFRRGKTPTEKRTGLVQICDSRIILLVQVSAMSKFPQKVKEVIENKDIIKLGANIRNDGQKLFRDYGLLPRNLVELGGLARQADPECTFTRSIVALLKVVERYTDKTLDKGRVRTSNWDAPLTPDQITYAANDAHCALMVYRRLMELAKENEREIRWDECSSDLAEVYRAKTSVPATAAPQEATAETVADDANNVAAAQPRTSSTPPSTTAPGSSLTTGGIAASAKPASPIPRGVYSGELPASAPAASSTSQSRPASLNSDYTPGAPRPQHLRAYSGGQK